MFVPPLMHRAAVQPETVHCATVVTLNAVLLQERLDCREEVHLRGHIAESAVPNAQEPRKTPTTNALESFLTHSGNSFLCYAVAGKSVQGTTLCDWPDESMLWGSPLRLFASCRAARGLTN